MFHDRFLRWDIKPMDEVKKTLDELAKKDSDRSFAEATAAAKKNLGAIERAIYSVS